MFTNRVRRDAGKHRWFRPPPHGPSAWPSPANPAGHSFGAAAPSRQPGRAKPPPEQRLARILPGADAVLGASVLLLGLYEYLLDDEQSPATLALRLALVALARLVCRTGLARRPALVCGALVYLIHAAALAIDAVSPAHGVRHATPVLLAWMSGAGLVEPWPKRCLRMLAPAALLYGGLALAVLPWRQALAIQGLCCAGMLLAIMAGVAVRRLWVETWRRQRQLLHSCRYDSLSGALSRGYLIERAEHDLALARRHERPLAIAMLDIDFFKRINDSHGHAAGDAVIRALVATCLHTLRATDYIGRFGGEEFVCVMPETGAEEALACAERMRTAFAGLQIGSGAGTMHGTVSIGVSVYSDQPDVDSLVRDADNALYQAKAAGRNRVILSRPGGFAQA